MKLEYIYILLSYTYGYGLEESAHTLHETKFYL